MSTDLDAVIERALLPGADRQEMRDALRRVRDELGRVQTLAGRFSGALMQIGMLLPPGEYEFDAIDQAGATAREALAPAPKPFRAGDHVRHRPSGESWVVAYQDGEYISWCGWPAGEARAADCELIKAATEEEHLALLRRLVDADDKRARMAQAALAAFFGGPDR